MLSDLSKITLIVNLGTGMSFLKEGSLSSLIETLLLSHCPHPQRPAELGWVWGKGSWQGALEPLLP